jgi:hypothetical protein
MKRLKYSAFGFWHNHYYVIYSKHFITNDEGSFIILIIVANITGTVLPPHELNSFLQVYLRDSWKFLAEILFGNVSLCIPVWISRCFMSAGWYMVTITNNIGFDPGHEYMRQETLTSYHEQAKSHTHTHIYTALANGQFFAPHFSKTI